MSANHLLVSPTSPLASGSISSGPTPPKPDLLKEMASPEQTRLITFFKTEYRKSASELLDELRDCLEAPKPALSLMDHNNVSPAPISKFVPRIVQQPLGISKQRSGGILGLRESVSLHLNRHSVSLFKSPTRYQESAILGKRPATPLSECSSQLSE